MATDDRDRTRARLIEVASDLLASGGPDAVTTRAVAEGAGVQAPTLYRLFGDKDGLLAEVAERRVADWVEQKRRRRPHPDPVVDLRHSWDLTVEFGVGNPGLMALMSEPRRARRPPSTDAGQQMLRDRLHRVALAGRLAVSEERAFALIRAAGTGVILTLLDAEPGSRDDGLAAAAFDAVAAAILTDPPAHDAPRGGAAAAVQLRAALPGSAVLSAAERDLLAEWLDRIAAG